MTRDVDPSKIDALLTRLPAHIASSLNAEQRVAVAEALREVAWKRHPVDIRMTLPVMGRRFYLTIVGGQEQRSANRLRIERSLRPVRTMGNMMFIMGIAAVFYLIAIFGIFFYSEVVEL